MKIKKCIWNQNGHYEECKNCKRIGKEFVIEAVTKDERILYELEGCGKLFNDNELERVQFTKSDLKNGDVITYRSGNKEIGKISQAIGLSFYNDDLTHKYNSNNDVVKVERPTNYKTVFKRKEEILDEAEKRYLRGVIAPFRDRILSICKCKYFMGFDNNTALINFTMKNDSFNLPPFKEDTMYKNMESGKDYTLEELGI